MVLSFELRNAIAKTYEYWYDNNMYEWSNKRQISFMNKIKSLKYDKNMPSLNKKELEKITWYWYDNFIGSGEFDAESWNTWLIIKPYLEKKGFDFF